MDSSAAALFVASQKKPTALLSLQLSTIFPLPNFTPLKLLFAKVFLDFQAELHCGDRELRVHSLRRRHVLAGRAGGGGGGESPVILFVFVYLCICVFVYLCICIFHGGGGGE